MASSLNERGVSVELRTYPDSGHGWFNWFWTRNSKQAHEHMIAWLRKTLG